MSASDTRQPLVSAPLPAKRPRRVVLPLLLLLAVAGAGGLGKLAYDQSLRAEDAQRRLDELDSRLQTLSGDQHAEEDRDVARQRQLQALQDRVAGLNATVNGDQRRQWQLAEVDYYIRLAQQHLLLTHDVQGAHALLDVANRILADANDNALLGLRSAITTDQLNLAAASHIDAAGIYLRLGALDQRISALSLPAEAGFGHRQDGTVQTPDAPAPTAGSGWQARAGELMSQGLAKFRGLITVRHYDEPIKPLLDDTTRTLVIENLRLHLGQAQLALLRGDDGVYSASLKTAQADFARYFQLLPAPEFGAIEKELTDLGSMSVKPVVPALTAVPALDAIKQALPQGAGLAAPAAASGSKP